MHFPTSSTLALVAVLAATSASADITNDDLSRDPAVQTEQIIEVIEDVFADESPATIDTTIRIAMCESGLRNRSGRPIGIIIHVETDGTVQQGDVDPRDTGAFQINPAMHSRAWKQENPFNPREIVDNVEYALALQEGRVQSGQYRFADWQPSRSCWS